MEVHLRKSPHGAYLQRTSTTTSRHLAAIQSVHAKRNELATFRLPGTCHRLLFCSTLASPDPNRACKPNTKVWKLSRCAIAKNRVDAGRGT
jgi:hypothetical protein